MCGFAMASSSYGNEVYLKYVAIQNNENYSEYKELNNTDNAKYFLEGRLYNKSKSTVTHYRIRLKYYDCDSNEDCIVIGRDSPIFDAELPWHTGVPVPPGEARDFKRAIMDMPKARENLKYSYKLEYPTKSFEQLFMEGVRKR